MNALEESVRKMIFLVRNPDHVVTRMTPSSLAGSTEIKVITHNTLVAMSDNWCFLTSIADYTGVNLRFLV